MARARRSGAVPVIEHTAAADLPVAVDKAASYKELVTERQLCRACPELVNASAIASGSFDSDRLGPWTRWQGNLDAELVVIGQDFAPVERFVELRGWPGTRVTTNLRLIRWLQEAGFDLEPPDHGQDRLFFTNAVLCLKAGSSMSTPVPRACFRRCAERFLRPVLDLIEPRAVATLGLAAMNALLHSHGLRRQTRLPNMVHPIALPSGPTLFAMHHPGSRGRPEESHLRDWRLLGAFLSR